MDPWLQILNVTALPLAALLSALAAYWAARAKQVSEGNATRANTVMANVNTVAAKVQGVANKVDSVSSSLAENTAVTKEVKGIVNGHRQVMENEAMTQSAEIAALKKVIADTKGTRHQDNLG